MYWKCILNVCHTIFSLMHLSIIDRCLLAGALSPGHAWPNRDRNTETGYQKPSKTKGEQNSWIKQRGHLLKWVGVAMQSDNSRTMVETRRWEFPHGGLELEKGLWSKDFYWGSSQSQPNGGTDALVISAVCRPLSPSLRWVTYRLWLLLQKKSDFW